MCIKEKKLKRTFLYSVNHQDVEESPEVLRLALIPSHFVSSELD